MHKINDPVFLFYDLFCGFGGTTQGCELAEYDGQKLVKVVAAVNHDPKAIKSHWLNHQSVAHYEEDIRTLDLTNLIALHATQRKLYPNAVTVLWASLECTNFSNAKGGQPRDADSRTLAEHLDRYIEALDPDYIKIENVREFKDWGPLDENNKPIAAQKGEHFTNWCNRINQYGYYNEWRILNSADFGAYTSRPRLFGCFAKHDLPIAWPAPTHSKNPAPGSGMTKWLPVKDKIDFTDTGTSILTRKKRLSDKTIEVIYKGCLKELNNEHNAFLFKYYGNGDNLNSINDPAGVIPTKDRFSIVSILYNFKTKRTEPVIKPLGSITTIPKANLLSFILNPSHFGHTTSTHNPSPVIIARQDKAPLYLSCIEPGVIDADLSLFFTDHDLIYLSEDSVYGPQLEKSYRIKLVELMIHMGISDIKMRLLKTLELLVIQGFPEDYKMVGNQTDMKKFIGNSVQPLVPKAWMEVTHDALHQWLYAA